MLSLPSGFFNECFLAEVYSNALSMSDKEYVKFQAGKTKEFLPSLPLDTLAVNTLRLKPSQALDTALVSSVWGSPDSMIRSYERHILTDDFTPSTFLSRGNATHLESFRSKDDWSEIAVYAKHCLVYGLPNIISLAFGIPQSRSEFVSFTFSAAEGSFPGKDDKLDALEYVTIPFYLGWLFQRNRIDEEYLKEYLWALKGVSLSQLKTIRIKVKNPCFKPEKIAEILHLSPATVRGQYLKLAPENKRVRGKSNQYIDRISLLNSQFDFLKWT